jgi:hypothetical protein
MGPRGVFTSGEDVDVMAWVLAMQEISMFITMHQQKMKVAKLTQTRQPHFVMVYWPQLSAIGSRIDTQKLSYKSQKDLMSIEQMA